MNSACQFSRQSGNGQIFFWQITSQLIRRENLRITRYLSDLGPQVKVFGKESVSLPAVVELIVMGAGVPIFIPSQRRLGLVQLEKWTNLFVDVGLHKRRQEAAI